MLLYFRMIGNALSQLAPYLIGILQLAFCFVTWIHLEDLLPYRPVTLFETISRFYVVHFVQSMFHRTLINKRLSSLNGSYTEIYLLALTHHI